MLEAPAPSADDEAIEQALTDLVMACPELVELEGRLSRFNVFRVLRASKHEIRHSNMLAWILDPDESHGLGDLFLRRWLMTVVHDAGGDLDNLPSPIEIDALDIRYVEVARESENIDLLVLIRTADDATWTVCIENKVASMQHSNQLRRYRDLVERRYQDATCRLYIFLTMNEEMPEDPGYISSTYETVAAILRRCVNERNDTIGSEPKFLLDQYLELLEEDFVGESRSALLARQIYRRHRKAIDFILENRRDPVSEASSIMEEVLKANQDDFGIVMAPLNKGYARFLPKEWDVPQNSGGTAWGPDSRYVAFEVMFWTKKVELHMTVAKAPDDWADHVWERAASAPFKQEWKKRPAQYIKPFKAKSDIAVTALADMEADEIRNQLEDWLRGELQKPRYRQAVEAMQELLTDLKDQ